MAQRSYVPHLGADFAYVHSAPFYELDHFQRAYDLAVAATAGFERVSVEQLTATLRQAPQTLLVLRTITGLGRNEFSASTELVASSLGLKPLSGAKVDSMERTRSSTNESQARVAAETLARVMAGTLFGDPPGDLRSKQDKPDTEAGWRSVRTFAADGVPYSMFLHQRHYGGAFRQLLDATSERRGNLIEDAVESLFVEHGIPHIRTGSHNQAEIAERFEVTVAPAPDLVVFDSSGHLQGLLECKGANDGGTAILLRHVLRLRNRTACVGAVKCRRRRFSATSRRRRPLPDESAPPRIAVEARREEPRGVGTPHSSRHGSSTTDPPVRTATPGRAHLAPGVASGTTNWSVMWKGSKPPDTMMTLHRHEALNGQVHPAESLCALLGCR